MNKIEQLQEIMQNSHSIVFFGGAGVSTESGIPDFRSKDGLYNQKYDISPEIILSHNYFMEHPDKFYEYYFDKMINLSIKPNAAHYQLAKWEKMSKITAIITQNIDGLHQLAGSKKVYELHGSIYNNHCIRCHKYYNINDIIKFKNKKIVPICSCNGIIKPDVVLYNEALNNITIDGAINAIVNCDTLIVAGTSLTVYPAAGLIDYFRGKNLILINKDDVHKNVNTLLTINEPVGETLKKINLN